MVRARAAGSRALLSVLLVGLVACDGTSEVPTLDSGATADGSSPPDGGGRLEVELASGRPGQWAPFEDGDVLRLQRGCQGSQHVFVSARVHGAAEGPLIISVTIRRLRDGEAVTVPFEVRLPFATTPAPGVREETGLMPVVLRASDIIDEEVSIEATLVDAEGERGEALRRALIRWGPDDCG